MHVKTPLELQTQTRAVQPSETDDEWTGGKEHVTKEFPTRTVVVRNNPRSIHMSRRRQKKRCMCVAYLGIKARLLASPGRKRSLLPRGEQGISTGRLTTWLYRRRRDADLVTF
jgi:hypothetical protein